MSLGRDLKSLPPIEDMVVMVRLLCTPQEIVNQPHWSYWYCSNEVNRRAR